MKLTMGTSRVSSEEPGSVERHFGFDFAVQKDGTLVTEDIPENLMAVAKAELKVGRLIESKTAQQEAEEAAEAAEKAANKASTAAKQAAEDVKTVKGTRGPGRPKK